MNTWLESQPLNYLQCRSLQHGWRSHRAEFWNGFIIETLFCPTCESEKDRYLKNGTPIRSVTRYSEGYLREGMGRMDRDDRAQVRLRAITLQYNI